MTTTTDPPGGPVDQVRALIRTASNPRLTRADVAVFAQIVAHVNRDTGDAWPGIDRLAELCGIKRRMVMYAIQHLEELGEILVEREIGRSNRYRAVWGETSAIRCTRATHCTGATERPYPCNEMTKPVQHSAPELALEPDKEPQKEKKGASRPGYQLFREGLQFLLRSGTKEKTARSFLGKLAKQLGDEAAARLVADAERSNRVDPMAWLAASMTRGKRAPPDSFESKLYVGSHVPGFLQGDEDERTTGI